MAKINGVCRAGASGTAVALVAVVAVAVVLVAVVALTVLVATCGANSTLNACPS